MNNKVTFAGVKAFAITKSGIAIISTVGVVTAGSIGGVSYYNYNNHRNQQRIEANRTASASDDVAVTIIPTAIEITTPSPTVEVTATTTPSPIPTAIPTAVPTATPKPTAIPTKKPVAATPVPTMSTAPSSALKSVTTLKLGTAAPIGMSIPSNWTMTSVVNTACEGTGAAAGASLSCLQITVTGARGEVMEIAFAMVVDPSGNQVQFAFSGMIQSGTTVDSDVRIKLVGSCSAGDSSCTFSRYVRKNAQGFVTNFYIQNGARFAPAPIAMCGNCAQASMAVRGGTGNSSYLQADSLSAMNSILNSLKFVK